MSVEERRVFAVPPGRGWYDGIDLSLLDRADEDERRILIQAEHPELHAALRQGSYEIEIDGQVVNPVLHIAMHEVVANQLWHDSPPEMWETARRLLGAGYERHEVLHMLASVVSAEVFETMRNQAPVDADKRRAALAALPESWERQRQGS